MRACQHAETTGRQWSDRIESRLGKLPLNHGVTSPQWPVPVDHGTILEHWVQNHGSRRDPEVNKGVPVANHVCRRPKRFPAHWTIAWSRIDLHHTISRL